MDSLEFFSNLFSGLDSAYGTYELNGARRDNGKAEGKALTKKGEVNKELFKKHLDGELSLGIVPIMKDNNCRWGCIDVDQYKNFNPLVIIKKIRKLKLPLFPYRSKSGGLHIFLHIDGKVPATDMIDKLTNIASRLGLGDCEIFPKQRTINVELGTIGNWLNLPYHNAKTTTRHAINDNGQSIPIEWLKKAVTPYLIKPEDFYKLQIEDFKAEDNLFNEYPPCVQSFIQTPVEEGGRNDALFNVGICMVKRYGKDGAWEHELGEVNKGWGEQAYPPKELKATVIKSLNTEKEYNYKCKTDIARKFCNQSECVKRKFGINKNNYSFSVDSFQKINTRPPKYILTIDKKPVKLTGQQLCQQQLLKTELFDSDIVWKTLEKEQFNMWLNYLKSIQTDVEGFDFEGDDKDEFSYTLRNFYEDSQIADHISQTQTDYIYEEDNNLYFRIEIFKRFLKKEGNNLKPSEVKELLMDSGAEYIRQHKDYKARLWKIEKPKIENIKDRNVKFKRDLPSFDPDTQKDI
jgi:hypothetical protein